MPKESNEANQDPQPQSQSQTDLPQPQPQSQPQCREQYPPACGMLGRYGGNGNGSGEGAVGGSWDSSVSFGQGLSVASDSTILPQHPPHSVSRVYSQMTGIASGIPSGGSGSGSRSGSYSTSGMASGISTGGLLPGSYSTGYHPGGYTGGFNAGVLSDRRSQRERSLSCNSLSSGVSGLSGTSGVSAGSGKVIRGPVLGVSGSSGASGPDGGLEGEGKGGVRLTRMGNMQTRSGGSLPLGVVSAPSRVSGLSSSSSWSLSSGLSNSTSKVNPLNLAKLASNLSTEVENPHLNNNAQLQAVLAQRNNRLKRKADRARLRNATKKNRLETLEVTNCLIQINHNAPNATHA
ncbi:hypothetical protein AAMO2058_001492500 [Amorphochlora amoebiformis]